MDIKLRITKLRNMLNTYGYLVPSTDEFQNEYVPRYARRLEYITGFTGSNGIAIILPHRALFFTDGRYHTQARIELDPNIFEVHDISEIKNQHLTEIIQYDSMLFTERSLAQFEHLNLQPSTPNMIDTIWGITKPNKPLTKQYNYPIEYSGQSSDDKIKQCLSHMTKNDADYLLITSVDSVCWLFNIRASDIEFSPVMLSYCIISKNTIWLFVHNHSVMNIKIETDIAISVQDITSLPNVLNTIEDKIAVDPTNCSIGLINLIKHKVYITDPCVQLKSIKNEIEILGSTNAHIKDAIALCEGITWLYKQIENSKSLTEFEFGETLTEIRSKQEGYISDSFPAIIGYQSNGAIIHYKATKDSAKTISHNGLLLIDSGAHYFGGTTDVTRTIAIGTPTQEQKLRYTQVLKGHLSLLAQKFPQGTTGGTLDILARQALWNDNVNYSHGTGHGVGNALFVHEGPQRIGAGNNVTLKKGMILSNEPGFYKENEYGIRIENLMYIDEDKNGYLCFRNLTMAPYCLELIDFTILEHKEIMMISAYHNEIYDKLSKLVNDITKKWLETSKNHKMLKLA